MLLKGVVPRDDIDEMIEHCDVWASLRDAELPPPLKSYDPDWENNPQTPRSLNNVEYGSEAFARQGAGRGRACVLALLRRRQSGETPVERDSDDDFEPAFDEEGFAEEFEPDESGSDHDSIDLAQEDAEPEEPDGLASSCPIRFGSIRMACANRPG